MIPQLFGNDQVPPHGPQFETPFVLGPQQRISSVCSSIKTQLVCPGAKLVGRGLPSGNLQFAFEHGHRNSRFTISMVIFQFANS